MDNWIAIIIIIIAVALIVGNFSTFQRTSHQKMRKTSLNDRKETLPRSHKTDHKMPTIDKNKLK